MDYTKLIPQHTTGASVEQLSTEIGSHAYRLAQLDDYAKTPRSKFPWRAPRSLGLSARASSGSIPGTWGFGFWNYPFGMSLGFGGTSWRLPTLPNAAWFFHASKENYLSFRGASTTPPTNGGSARYSPGAFREREVVGHGFLAQVFRSPKFHPLLIPAGLALPFSRKATRQLMGRFIGEDGIDLRRKRSPAPSDALENAQYTGLDVTQWHKYRLDWREERVAFEVDEVQVFESVVSPHPPLGLVIWIDNQYAAFTPEGKIGFGVLENSEPAWLEIKDIEIS